MLSSLTIAFVRGIADSLRGFLAIFYLDRIPPAGSATQDTIESIVPISSTSPPLTTLAQRRLESKKQLAASKNESSKKTAGAGSKSGSEGKPKAWRRLLACVVLNLLCIVILHYIVAPAVEATVIFVFGDRRVIGIASILSALWVLPVFLITRLVNALWFQVRPLV